MTADVNVTEKMARAANPGAFFPWSKPHERDHEIARAERALGVLADPDVLAGIAQVHHDFHHPRTCRGGCAGVDEVDEEFAAAVVELLKGGGVTWTADTTS